MSKIVSSFTSDTRFNDVLVHRFVINIMVETNTFYTHTQSHTHSTNELNYNNVRLIECPLQHIYRVSNTPNRSSYNYSKTEFLNE